MFWKVRAMPLSVRLDGRVSSTTCTVEDDRAGVGGQHAGHEIEERRLAGAVRTDQCVNVALRHLHAEFVQRVEAAEALGQPLDGETDRAGGRYHA